MIAVLYFSIVAAGELTQIVGGGPVATTILLMTSIGAFSFFAGVYVAPHVRIGKAVSALLEKGQGQ